MKHFKTAKKGLAAKRKLLKDLLKSIEDLEEDDEPEKFARCQTLKMEADALTDEIARIEANTNEDEYYAQNSDLIFQYFDDKAPLSSEVSDATTPVNVLQFLQNSNDREESETSPTSEPKKRGQQGVHDYFQLKENLHGRKKILDKYMSNIDSSYVIAIERTSDDTCPECKESLSTNTNEGISECTNCGFSQLVKVDSDKRSYKETTNTEMSYITYKRINHFDREPKSLEWNSELKVCYSLVVFWA